MNYEDAVQYIRSRLHFGIRPGLERIESFLDRLDNPQKNLKFIHIAGTNGKGSTAAMIASVLKEAGYKTGLFTSPYVSDFCDRIAINGEMISHEALAEIVSAISPLADAIEKRGDAVTEFEFITTLAFAWFFQENCDVVVLETGLGGTLDATNVIDNPLISVITKIAYDHMHILGNSLSEITEQKCGIIKENTTTVSYTDQPLEALEIILKTVCQKNGRLVIGKPGSAHIIRESIFSTEMEYGNLTVTIPLAGTHQVNNTITAIETVQALSHMGFAVSEEAIRKGIQNVSFPARQEIISQNPIFILDGAHNPDGMKSLADSVKRFFPGEKKILIMGMLQDKQVEKALSFIAPYAEKIYAVTPDNPRAMPSERFAQLACKFSQNVCICDNPVAAVEAAVRENPEDSVFIMCGSLYLAGQIRPYLIKKFK